MRPPVNPTPHAVALEISRLRASLAETKTHCGYSATYLRYIKSQVLETSNKIASFRNHLLLFHDQARALLASNQLVEYQQKLRSIAEIEKALEDKIVIRDQFGVRMEKVGRELRDIRQEVLILQNTLNGLRNRGRH